MHSQQRRRTERHTVWIVANEISLMVCSKFDEDWIFRYQSHENIVSVTSLGIVQKPTWLHQHSGYQWNFPFFRTGLSTHLAPFQSFQTCLAFLLLLLLLVVVYQIQPSKVIKLQQHSPLSIYVHQMIISPPCLFKHMKNDERVAMLFKCLLDHTQQKFYFCLISLLRSNMSESVFINLRHSVD